MSDKVRLNLGSGSRPIEGYYNVDRKFDGAPEETTGICHVGEVFPLKFRNDPGPMADGAADEIRASHVLEHFSHRQTLDVLREWVRVLKPGGVLKVAVPDFDKIVNYYVNGSGELPLEGFVFGGHVDDDDRHGAMFNAQKLTTLMRMAGLGDVRPWTSEVKDCASLPVSLNLAGVKGAPEYPNLKGQVAACFSIPRFGPLDTMFCAMETFTKLGIPAIRKSGAFWHQCLTGAIELQLQTGSKYILCLDYDSLFSVDDVLALYRVMEAHPEVDALCPIQCGRDRSTPLMTVADAEGKNRSMLDPAEMAKELLELRTAHFGCTFFRADAFAKLAKPWFNSVPDENGTWGEGRVDADIKFWFNFRDAGLRVFQANRVAIGHGQWVASFPNQNLETQHIYTAEYVNSGKPEWAWR